MTTIRKAAAEDLQKLREISIETFRDTFARENTPENLNAYMNQAFDEQKLALELTEPNSTFYLLEIEGQLAGFLKLNVGQAQSEALGDEALEIERLYIRREFKRQGLGRQLIELALHEAREQGKHKVWLGVWEKNTAAIAFYECLGFVRAGEHAFQMGDEQQIDWILVRSLSARSA